MVKIVVILVVLGYVSWVRASLESTEDNSGQVETVEDEGTSYSYEDYPSSLQDESTSMSNDCFQVTNECQDGKIGSDSKVEKVCSSNCPEGKCTAKKGGPFPFEAFFTPTVSCTKITATLRTYVESLRRNQTVGTIDVCDDGAAQNKKCPRVNETFKFSETVTIPSFAKTKPYDIYIDILCDKSRIGCTTIRKVNVIP